MRKLPVIVLIGLAGLFAACDRQPAGLKDSSAQIATEPDSSEYVEARTWLKTNGHPAALASNRFDTTKAAAEFVEQLYSNGAVEVRVTNIDNDPAELQDGGPYSDTLVVVLPGAKDQRVALFKIADKEARESQLRAEPDTGQKTLLFWWD